MLKRIPGIDIKGNEILGDLSIDFFNKETKEPYKIVAFVGENGCGKTTLLNCLTKIEGYHYVFMRQNSMLVGMTNEALKYLSGKEVYTVQNKDDLTGGQNVFQLRINSTVNNKTAAIELLKSLNDDELIEMYESSEIDKLRCGGKVTETIAGQTGSDLNTFSSGQQEILLKLKTLRQAQLATDVVLLDEPEASLHPRWQKKIVNLVRDMVADNDGNVPQLFIATHSEKVLESLIKDKDALIIRLFKEDKKFKAETINQMDLKLPSPTFAELDYVVFHIPTLEYHDQLLSRFADLYDLETIWEIDKAIKKHEKYDGKQYKKIWISETKKGIVTYKTLPVYIRNYFHHPKKDAAPTEEELVKSILFMRELISSFED